MTLRLPPDRMLRLTRFPKTWTRRMVLGLGVLAVFALAIRPAAASDTTTRWQTFSESPGCDASFTRTPFASKRGSLGNDEAVLGPYGTYFGRSLSEVRVRLVYWTMPGSGGRRIQVHRAMLPDLNRVAANLNAHAAQGRVYPVSSVSGFVSRTISGTHQISRHSLGLALDINPAQNPHRSDGRLITNMPAWFIDAWTSEGFCWGGSWLGEKDAMHFSWMGPGGTESASDSIQPIPPRTANKSFERTATHSTVFRPVISRYRHLGVGDVGTNGAPDVIGVRSHPGGAVLDAAIDTRGFGECSVTRWFIESPSIADADHIVLADVDGDSGQDLIALTATSGDKLAATTATRLSAFEDLRSVVTGLDVTVTDIAAADFDGDRIADLWEATAGGRVRIWKGPSFTQVLDDSSISGSSVMQIAAGDRDGGNRPELFVMRTDGRVDVFTHSGGWSQQTSFTSGVSGQFAADLAAADYDGDGRADIQVLDGEGRMLVFVGNTSTGVPPARWFTDPDPDCNDPIRLAYRGAFFDDDSSIFEGNIESIAAAGVTRGCNRPFNDRFCPRQVVTRETMAAFLVRALGLTENTHPGFKDVAPGSTFAEDIGRLATAGVTKGCNPPANDRFCPKASVTRETMAAFLVRGLGLTDARHPGFKDVPVTGVFANDISRLARAGITKGCNPPSNTQFCPKDPVTRETMAAFLDRAGLGE